MKMSLLLGFCFFCLNAQADMVFMRENNQGKHIFLKNQNGEKQITTGTNWHLYPDISSDGKNVVYVAGADQKNLELHLQSLELSKSTILSVPMKGMLLHPKFTKNNQQIFFSAPVNGINSIFAMDLKNEKKLTAVTPDEEAYFPRPSSDGQFVVYQRNLNGKKEVVFFDRIENKKEVIDIGMSPALSFDERFIAYTSKQSGSWDIFIYDRFTKVKKQITTHEADEMAPTFAPDNSVSFASNSEGHFYIYKLIDGNWQRQTFDSNSDDYAPQYVGETNFKQSTLAPFIGAARSSFGTVMHKNKLYMIGGHQGAEHTYPPESFSDTMIVYDVATNKWTELASRPHKAHGYQVIAHGNYIYAFGGFAYSAEHKPKWKSLDVVDRYDIEKNEWTTVAKLPRPRSSNQSIVIGSKVYLVGGWDSTPKFANDLDGTFHGEVDIFDLETETAYEAPYKMPLPLRRAFTAVEYQGKMLLIGGLGQGASHFELISKLTLVDPQTGVSEELTEMPFATFAPAAGIIGDELYVFGGMFKTGEMNYEYVSHIYAFNFKTKEWRHTGRFVNETKGFSQVFNIDDQTLGILGGHHYYQGYDMPVTTFETFSK